MGVCRKFSRGGQRQHFANPCQVADDAIQMYVHDTLNLFYITKKTPHVTTTVTKTCLFDSHSQQARYITIFTIRYPAYFQSRVLRFTEGVSWSLTKPQIMTLFYLARLISVT